MQRARFDTFSLFDVTRNHGAIADRQAFGLAIRAPYLLWVGVAGRRDVQPVPTCATGKNLKNDQCGLG
jgi:hypothetical protein